MHGDGVLVVVVRERERRRNVSKITKKLPSKSSYPVMKQCLPGVLHLLKQSIRLENVDDADEEQQPLALVIGSSDGAGTETKTQKRMSFR